MKPELSKIPKELTAGAYWVCHQPDKVPINPKTGGNAQADNPDTWGTLAQALKHYEAHKDNGIAGIGREFSYYDPYFGIDLDHCRDPETGEIAPWAWEIIKRFNSYTEISPSGTGVHIWGKGKLPPGADHQKNLEGGGKIEVYDVGRYFTVTGHHLEGTPATIQDRDKELKAFHAQVIAKTKPPPKPTSTGPALDLTDSALIDKAILRDPVFARLWQGDTSGQATPSEADYALVHKLAWWTNKDPGRIDQLFRQSGLCQDPDRLKKWDRLATSTINKAIANTEGGYDPGKRMKGPQDPPPAPEAPKIIPTPTITPPWPQEVMTGAAGKFARTYSAYLETPESFLFAAYLTFLGHVISDRITLDSEIVAQPRLFTIILGESGDTRKSTSVGKTNSFYQEVIAPDDFNTVWGVGSAEGLAKCFKKNKRAILILDELKSLIQKMRIDASVLLPCINTLFESKRFHSFTKKHDIIIDDAELCLLAASTLETYRNMFNSTFMDIGFLNRLFIVIGDSQRKFSIPGKVPQAEKESLKLDLQGVLSFVGELSRDGCFSMPINSTARDIFDDWYFNLEASAYTRRLDTYGHRLMPLLAVNEMKDSITPEIAEKTIALLRYQLAARKFADPIDADSAIARLEERIRRLLSGVPLPKRDLERRGNKNRVGIWAWDQAIKNLRNAGEIFWDSKTREFRLNA